MLGGVRAWPFPPFGWSGTVKVHWREMNDGELSRFAEMLKFQLGRESPKKIEQFDNVIRFVGGVFRPVSNWNILLQITQGEIELTSSAEWVTARYRISFTQLLVFAAIVSVVPLAIATRDADDAFGLLGLTWLWLVGGNVAICLFRFPRHLKKAIHACLNASSHSG